MKKREPGPNFLPKGKPKLPVTRGGAVIQKPTREQVRGGAVTGTRPSGASSVRAYRKALESEAYKRATPAQKKKFRKDSEADLAQFKDVV